MAIKPFEMLPLNGIFQWIWARLMLVSGFPHQNMIAIMYNMTVALLALVGPTIKLVETEMTRAWVIALASYATSFNSMRPRYAYMGQYPNQHWFRQWLVAWTAPSHYLNQCRDIVHWRLRNNSRTCIWKCRLQHFDYFVSASMC